MGHNYWLTLVDSFTRQGWSLALKTKHQAKGINIHWIIGQERQQKQQVQVFHCDRGWEFLNTKLEDWFKCQGITLDLAKK